MHIILTLLASSSSIVPINKVLSWLKKNELHVMQTSQLKENEAYDVLLESKIDAEKMSALYTLARDEWQIDVIAQPDTNRVKKLLIADMDSTMVEDETLDIIADILGFGEKVSAITDASMRGELDFKASLIERVKLLHGAPVSALEEAWARTKISAGAQALVQGMKQAGATTMLVSGGFTYFTEKVADAIGFDAHMGNELEIIDGTLTGQLLGDILDRNAKEAILHESCHQLNITLHDTLAVGDGANDIAMLKAAGLGIAYRGKPAVRKACKQQLNVADLDSLLYAQGLGK